MNLPDSIFWHNNLAGHIGLVIGSYAAMPYVHLHLETARQKYPLVSILVQDDGSPCQSELKNLCDTYGADFQSNPERLPNMVGDLQVYAAGLEWAKVNGINLLYKFSRRFIPVMNWVPEAHTAALLSQAATFSSHCTKCNFGFRTESVGFHVPSWIDSGLHADIVKQVSNRTSHFVEGYMHGLARHFIGKVCRKNDAWVLNHPEPDSRNGYTHMRFMGTNRFAVNPEALWHDVDQPIIYYRQARTLGITRYALEDFNDPNSCHGFT
jgi:hypothetical protein